MKKKGRSNRFGKREKCFHYNEYQKQKSDKKYGEERLLYDILYVGTHLGKVLTIKKKHLLVELHNIIIINYDAIKKDYAESFFK